MFSKKDLARFNKEAKDWLGDRIPLPEIKKLEELRKEETETEQRCRLLMLLSPDQVLKL